MRYIFCQIIKAYQFLISPLLAPNCRFAPSCSAYTREAMQHHGAAKGLALGIKRLCKCHPWSAACWHDPVPESIAWAQIIGYKRPL